MKKSELKEIIKTCLIEILAEGIGPSGGQRLSEVVQQSSRQLPRRHVNAAPAPRQRQHAVPPAATVLAGGNSAMEAIFADTALTTLPVMMAQPDPESANQMMSQHLSNRDAYPMVNEQSSFDPYEEFARQTQQTHESPSEKDWDAVAFGPSKMIHPTGVTTIPKEYLDRKVG